MIFDVLIPLIAALPLAGFALTAVVGRRLDKEAHWLPVGMVLASWVLSMIVAFSALTASGPFADGGYGVKLWDWIPAGTFNVQAGLFVDNLTACLLIVVTTVGLLVHVYSIGYMAHDAGYWRFFAYLNLFMVSMLILVLGDSFLTVFVAWELVGLSSYLLIGFWYRKRSAALAAKKAFIVNRVGDVGFALGIMAIFASTGTLDIRASIEHLISGAPLAVPLPVIALLVFTGAVGKSAQFPLHVWLPDAMEGPTPVSALIHAATMVNAGVYLVARANPIFGRAPEVMVVVAAIGIFTAILAASIAFTQTDIKRVLAYSTLSQLGYMFAALGVGAWTAAIFHLMAHGFFKGLLFLDSGSVIHAVHDEQDMRRMGGLWRRIPITYWTMLIGAVAISGIPPLAGFFSKDEILGEAFKNGFLWVWAIGFVVAGMTAFYMFRLMGLTFWGESRVDPEVEPKIHESPPAMSIPLVLLAIPSVLLGLAIGFPPEDGLLHRWLAPVFEETEQAMGRHAAAYQFFGIDGVLFIATVGIAAIAIVVAWRIFGVELLGLRLRPRRELATDATTANGLTRFLYRASLNKWWFDDLNDLLFIRIGGRVAMFLWWFDRTIVDGAVNGIGALTGDAGRGLRRIQTGRVQNYALGIALGLLVMAGSYLLIVGR
ncbi:MAG TPA: NADH-quinone oxidoreductase subunit L [Candidatus Limnocylindrales bacterium]|nr:NADH-quinone oxidoreductase subunit L [Candidatus Limnocylindrales bacterium]